MSKMNKMDESEEIILPTTFEKHIEKVSEEREGALNNAMWLSVFSLLIPILGCTFGFQYLIMIDYDPLSALAIIVVAGVLILYGAREYQNHIVDYLKGKEMLLLTFRLRKGFWFSDFALIKDWKLLNPDAKKLSQLLPELANPHDMPIYEYEVTFEDFPYFDSMVLYSPCPKDDLIQNTPQIVLYKQFITGASGAALSVVRLKEFVMGELGIVPHVYPTDSDYEAEKLLGLAGLTPVSKGIIDQGAKVYEAVKYLELFRMYEGVQRENVTLNDLLDKTTDRSARMAASLAEDYIEAGKVKASRFPLPFGWLQKHWKLMLFFTAIFGVFLFIMYGGYLF